MKTECSPKQPHSAQNVCKMFSLRTKIYPVTGEDNIFLHEFTKVAQWQKQNSPHRNKVNKTGHKF